MDKEKYEQLRLPIRACIKTDEEILKDDPFQYLRKVGGRGKMHSVGNTTMMIYSDLDLYTNEGNAEVNLYQRSQNGSLVFVEGYIVTPYIVEAFSQLLEPLIDDFTTIPTGVEISPLENAMYVAQQTRQIAEYVHAFIKEENGKDV